MGSCADNFSNKNLELQLEKLRDFGLRDMLKKNKVLSMYTSKSMCMFFFDLDLTLFQLVQPLKFFSVSDVCAS